MKIKLAYVLGVCMIDRNAAIDQMVRRIVEGFHPEKVILFGSQARGEQTPDSDVDLLVVMCEIGDRRALSGMGLPKDVVVLISDEFETKRSIPGAIAYPADKEGKVLYAA